MLCNITYGLKLKSPVGSRMGACSVEINWQSLCSPRNYSLHLLFLHFILLHFDSIRPQNKEEKICLVVPARGLQLLGGNLFLFHDVSGVRLKCSNGTSKAAVTMIIGLLNSSHETDSLPIRVHSSNLLSHFRKTDSSSSREIAFVSRPIAAKRSSGDLNSLPAICPFSLPKR
jgi:hypothetical protein